MPLLNKFLIISVALLAVLCCFNSYADCQVITETARPLEKAADLLERLYGKPVTYEDPILLWKGDTEPVPYAKGNVRLVPVRQSFSMPVEADPNVTPVLDLPLLNKVIDSYHQRSDGPRFKVASSAWGFHIIPSQVRDENGRFVDERSLLDVPIAIPKAKRTPAEHLHEICASITASTGIRLDSPAMYMNERFTPSSIKVHYRFRWIAEEDLDKISFEWGAANMTARQAVISLFERSATSLSWRLLCEADGEFCVLNVLPVQVYFTDSDGKRSWKALEHDREEALPK